MKTRKTTESRKLGVRWQTARWTPVVIHQECSDTCCAHRLPRFQFKPARSRHNHNATRKPMLQVRWGRLENRG
jgi:hypothetical protein